MKKYLPLTCLLTILSFGCYHISKEDYPKEVKLSLNMAGDNVGQLEQVLVHYSQRKKDAQKFKAACFLISNMRYHIRPFIHMKADSKLSFIVHLADSLYYNEVKGKTLQEIKGKRINQRIDSLKNRIQSKRQTLNFHESQNISNNKHLSDLQLIKADFLINQIDNAFEVRRESPFLKELSFKEFCEYILPYNMIDNIPIRKNGKQLNEIFSKYLNITDTSDVTYTVKLYNRTIWNLRKILGNYPLKNSCGFEELLFSKNGFDCFPIADWGYLILNACGLPVDIEYNMAYTRFVGYHAQCNVDSSLGNYSNFSPESEVPKIKKSKYEDFGHLKLMNLYQIEFFDQYKNPYFLKAAKEYVPSFRGIGSPLTKDVTANSILTVPLKLPYKKETENHLAYLATFNRNRGIAPVTWGVINKEKREVFFKQVIPDRLYFPVYYEGHLNRSFGSPFYLKLLDSTNKKVKIIYLKKPDKTDKATILTRKFPLKKSMKKVANNLIGTVVIGSKNYNFSHSDTLFKFKNAPKPYMQDIHLHIRKSYSYYQIIAPEAHPKMNIAEIMFLTCSPNRYEYEYKPRPLSIHSPDEININNKKLYWILDGPKEKMENKWEYDNNMLTAPSAYPSISLRLKNPIKISTIRFAPLNADNGILPGDKYSLYYWSGNQWELFKTQMAQYNYVQFENIPSSVLYWLKDETEGKEEMPFILQNGRQKFVYRVF